MNEVAIWKVENELEEIKEEISNIDGGKIPIGVEQLLRNGKHWTMHCAWDHWGAVWFADGQFHERVMTYHQDREVISNASLRDLIDEVNEKYGHR